MIVVNVLCVIATKNQKIEGYFVITPKPTKEEEQEALSKYEKMLAACKKRESDNQNKNWYRSLEKKSKKKRCVGFTQ